MEYELEVKYQNKILKGIIINENKKILVLKLNSGYNANLNKNEIEIISKTKIKNNLESNKNNSEKEKKDIKNKDLPKITIIHTGGTIASKVDYKTGAVSFKFTPEELLTLFPELNKIAQIEPKMIQNMASDDMRFDHYNIMLKEIENAIKNKQIGVIISHGTDTLHYTSAALQYAIKNLPIPVILVGAQRSSDRPSSDAFTNLEAATKFIIENAKQANQFKRVGICMHENLNDNTYLIIDGINAKKMHSTRRDAFKQINYPAFARIKKTKIEIIRKELQTQTNKQTKTIFTPFNPKLKIGYIKAHPHMYAEEISNYKKFDALIIEGTGLGHIPISKIDDVTQENPKILKEVENLIENNIKVIIGVQTTYGEVNRNVYSPGRVLEEKGVLANHMNLTTESLFCRTAHILSKTKTQKEFEKLWEENLEGFKIRTIKID